MRMTVIDVREELIAYYERRGYRRTGLKKPFPYGDVRWPAQAWRPALRSAGEDAVTAWVRVCAQGELLPGESQVAWDGDTPILVVNLDGELYALEDKCSHEDFELKRRRDRRRADRMHPARRPFRPAHGRKRCARRPIRRCHASR